MRFTSLAGNKTSPSVRVFLAAVVAVGLAGCDPDYLQREIVTDARGCKWAAIVVRFQNGGSVMRAATPLKGSDGKPMCGTP